MLGEDVAPVQNRVAKLIFEDLVVKKLLDAALERREREELVDGRAFFAFLLE